MSDWSPPRELLNETPRHIQRRRVFPPLSFSTIVATIMVGPFLILHPIYAPVAIPTYLALRWVSRRERRQAKRLVQCGIAVPATVLHAKPVRVVSRSGWGSERHRPGCEVTVRYESGGQILRADARLGFEVEEGDVLTGLVDADDPHVFTLYACSPYRATPHLLLRTTAARR